MTPDKRGTVFESTDRVSVTRAKKLSDKLARLSDLDLQQLRRYWELEDYKSLNEILAKVSIEEYQIQELKVALAMLEGVHRLPLTDKPLGHENAQIWEPKPEEASLPPKTVITPRIERPAKLSVPTAREIADRLAEMPRDDFLWLAEHLTDSKDKRSRLLIVQHRLYRFRIEDVAAGIAALRGTLPPVPPGDDDEESSEES
ncbi:MAG: hypothetical protein ACFFDP_08180 [Promethearchaeota archaeon]